MNLKLIMIFLMLSPLTTLAGDANTETSVQVSNQQGSASGGISTITGRILQVRRRTAARLRVSTSKEQELMVLTLHEVDSGVQKQCHGKYYLQTSYNRYSEESRVKLFEFRKLGGTWVELSVIKIIHQGEKYAACLFGHLKSISEPK